MSFVEPTFLFSGKIMRPFLMLLLLTLTYCQCQVTKPIFDWALCNNGPQQDNPYHGYDCINERDVSKSEICDPRKISSSDCLQYNLNLKGSSQEDIRNLQTAFSRLDEDNSIRRLVLSYPLKSFGIIAPIFDELLSTRPILYVRNETFPWQRAQFLTITIDKYHQGFDKKLKLLGASNYPDKKTCSETALLVSRTNCIHPGYASAISMYYAESHDHPFAPLAIYISRSNLLSDGAAFVSGGDFCPYLNRWNCAFLPSTNCAMPANISQCRDSQPNEFCVYKPPDAERFSAIYYKDAFLLRENSLFSEMNALTKQPISALQKKINQEPDNFHGGPYFRHIHPKMVNNSIINASSFVSMQQHMRQHRHNHHTQRFYTRTPDVEKHLNTYSPVQRDAFEAVYQSLYFLRPVSRYRALVGKELRQFAIDNDIDGLYGYNRQQRNAQIAELKALDGNSLYDAREATGYIFPSNEQERNDIMSQINGTILHSRRLHTGGFGKKHRELRNPIDNNSSNSNSNNHPPFRCVAVHMRRGDRIMRDMNESAILQYCKDNPNNPAAHDKGCPSIPFQLITLENITHAASTLVDINEVNNLVVLTEDDEWLVNEVEKLKKSYSPWKVNVLLGPWNNDRDFAKTEERWRQFGRTGLQAGVHFLSSMQVIRNCEAFVGHFGSAATHIFYVNMCVQHGVNLNRQASCPPVFDLRGVRGLYP